MDANTLRRLNWLWKHRHTHTDDSSNVEQRLIVIESGLDGVASTSAGAYLHVGNSTTQEIADGGAQVEFASLLRASLAFPALSLPADEVGVQVPGYYDVQCHAGWDSYQGGGTVWLVRVRGGTSQQVWPPDGHAALWDSVGGSRFDGNAPAINLQPGDVLQLWVDGGSGSAEDLAYAVMVPRLLDRLTGGAPAATVPGFAYDGITFSSFENPYNLPLPPSQAGDLLIIVAWMTSPSASGWTLLTSVGDMHVLWKVADGSESSTVAVTRGGGPGCAMFSTRFRNYGDWSVDIDSSASGTTKVFPTASVPGGSGDYWVIPFGGYNLGTTTTNGPTATPSGYPTIVDGFGLTSWATMWAGANFELVEGSVSPGSLTFDADKPGYTGVLLVKGG